MVEYSQTKTITAFFDSWSEANNAVRALHDAGVSDTEIRLTLETEQSADTEANDKQDDEDRGFFGALADFFMPDEIVASTPKVCVVRATCRP